MAANATRKRKGESTRLRILERAAPVFNQRGYAGASMSELVEATGLEKGGIYNHFGSKDDLALESFSYAISRIVDAFAGAQDGVEGVDRLTRIVSVFGDWAEKPLIPGGCPIMNTAIESDDTHPPLADQARVAMESWHRLIGAILKQAKARGEVADSVDPYQVATVVTATLEGSLMLTKLFRDPSHMHRAVRHLTDYIEDLRERP
jgi:TetR/AcrR family transcriptional repressor of nem operon